VNRIEQKLELLKEMLKNPKHLVNTMEVPFYIFNYDIEDEFIVRYHMKKIVNSLSFKVDIADLFEIFIKILKDVDYLSYLFGREKEEIFENILSFIPDVPDKIIEIAKDADMLFITGISEAYPFLRVYDILNDIEGHLNIPVIVFYPGTFNGVNFWLFGKIEDGVYYRANSITDEQ